MRASTVAHVCAAGVALVGATPAAGQRLTPDVAPLVELAQIAGRASSSDVRTLTLDEAIERALDQNLDIAVERLSPAIQDLTVAQAQAVFLPTLSSAIDFGRSLSPSRSQLDGAGRITQQAIDTEAGRADLTLEQRVPWFGGQYSVGWDNGRTPTTSSLALIRATRAT